MGGGPTGLAATSTGSTGSIGRRHAAVTAALGAILAIALALRLIPIFVIPSFVFPDEIFQTTEQAHRLVFGWGVVPWEYEVGIRSWVFPGILAGVIEVSRLLGEGPGIYVPFVGVTLALLSLAPVICGFLWGRRFTGIAGAVVTGALVALWYELAYFGARALTEVVAAHVLVVGVYLAYPGDHTVSRRRLWWAGAMFGLAFVLRFHLAPAIATVGLWVAWPDWRRRLLPIAAAATTVVALGGLVDALTWGSPFQSVWLNVQINVFYDVSSDFGTAPWYYYAGVFTWYWSGAIAVIALTALVGARRLPLLLVAIVVIIISHSLIGHKEYRYAYPAIMFTVILCGVGTAELLVLVRRATEAVWTRWYWAVRPAVVVPTAIVFWGLTSAALGVGPAYQRLWYSYSNMFPAMRHVAELTEVCGIAVYNVQGAYDVQWWQLGGYYHFHQPVPFYDLHSEEDLRDGGPSFNVLIYDGDHAPPAGLFTPGQCWVQPSAWLNRAVAQHRLCVATRAGACAASSAPRLETGQPPSLAGRDLP